MNKYVDVHEHFVIHCKKAFQPIKIEVKLYDRLGKLKAAGKTAKEAADAEPLADIDENWGAGMFKSSRWIELIYPGV